MIVQSAYTIRRAVYSVALGRIRCFCLSQVGRDHSRYKRQQIFHFA